MSLTDRHAFIVAGRELAPPPGLEVTNHLDPDVLTFAGQSRVGRKVDELIIHESVTRSAVSTVAVLQRRKLGVHLIVAPDGRVFQHADLAHVRLAHAGGHNGPSVGVEVVNPYYPYASLWAHGAAIPVPAPRPPVAPHELRGRLGLLGRRQHDRWSARPESLPMNDVFIVEGSQLRYGSKDAWDAAYRG